MDFYDLMQPVERKAKQNKLKESDQPAEGGSKMNTQAFSAAYKNLIDAENKSRTTVQYINKMYKAGLKEPPVSMDPATKKKILIGIGLTAAVVAGGMTFNKLRKVIQAAGNANATPVDVLNTIGSKAGMPSNIPNGGQPPAPGADASEGAADQAQGDTQNANAQDANTQTNNQQGANSGGQEIENSIAAQANAKPGDIITRKDGTRVTLTQGDINWAKQQQASGGEGGSTQEPAQELAQGASQEVAQSQDAQDGEQPAQEAPQDGGIQQTADATQDAVGGNDLAQKVQAQYNANYNANHQPDPALTDLMNQQKQTQSTQQNIDDGKDAVKAMDMNSPLTDKQQARVGRNFANAGKHMEKAQAAEQKVADLTANGGSQRQINRAQKQVDRQNARADRDMNRGINNAQKAVAKNMSKQAKQNAKNPGTLSDDAKIAQKDRMGDRFGY